MGELTAFNATLTSDSGGWVNYTLVDVFKVAGLSLPAGDITAMRITFRGPTAEGSDMQNCYVGHAAASGDPYDFSATPVQVTFDGGSSSKYIVSGSDILSDWVNFAYNKTSNLVIAMAFNTPNDTLRYKTGEANVDTYYAGGSLAATVNKTGFSILSGQLFVVKTIEVRYADGSTGGFFLLAVP